MARLRFTTAQEVLEAFPPARDDIGVALGDEPPLACLDSLARGAAPDAALAFCSYLLPRREAVSWGCRSLRALLPGLSGGPQPALEAAETWVRGPEDASRRAALKIGMNSDPTIATTWLALAAGWAGGSMVEGEHAVPAPAHLTAKAIRAALLLGLGAAPAEDRGRNIGACVAIGRRLAEGKEVF